jgi:TonB dependent receptor
MPLHPSPGGRHLPLCSLLALLAPAAGEDAPTPLNAPLPLPASTAPSAAPPRPAAGAFASETLTVIGQPNEARNQVPPGLGASTYDIGPAQIQAQAKGADAPFNEVLLRMPGVAQDSFGQVHLRGEHANLQYRIDDIMLPDGITAFGQEIDTRFAHSVTLITGALPAQYGLRTAGVVDISTKSGSTDGGGELSLYGGSFGTLHGAASYGASSGRWEAYASASAQHSDLGIENPTASRSALHDESSAYHGFLYLSYLLDASSRISLITSASDSAFQIPDNPGQPPLFTIAGAPPPLSATVDESQWERNSFAVLAYQTALGAAALQIAPFIRDSRLVFAPDEAQDLAFNGAAGWLDRRALSAGVQADASLPLSAEHLLRGGAFYSSTWSRAEATTAVFPVDGLGNQTSTTAQAIIDDSAKVGSLSSVYAQDQWLIASGWTVNCGLRFDRVAAYVDQSQLSPRLNTTFELTPSTTIHGGYAHYFTPPPLESVSQETVAAFAQTSNAAPSTVDDPVRSERADYVDLGISQRIGEHAAICLDGYYKRSHDQLDEGQFGTAVVFTPFNYREGRIIGSELTASYQDRALTTYANLAVSQAQGRDIDSAQFLFTTQELSYAQGHWVALDHDQRYTASCGLSYLFPTLTRLSLDALGGTGLRDGFDNTGHLPAYATVNLALSQQWQALTVRLDVVNLFDRIYQIRDGSGIGVFAPQYGQRRGAYGGMTWAF